MMQDLPDGSIPSRTRPDIIQADILLPNMLLFSWLRSQHWLFLLTYKLTQWSFICAALFAKGKIFQYQETVTP